MAVLSVSGSSIIEGDNSTSQLVFTLSLDSASAAPVTVEYHTTDSTASAAWAGDYASLTGLVTFDAGQTSKQVSITVSGDTTVEDAERFILTLTNVSGATFANDAAALSVMGTILNDDGAAPGPDGPTTMTYYNGPASAHASLPTLTAHGVILFEGPNYINQARFLITLDKAPTAPVSFNYYVQDGSASGAQFNDYGGKAGTVTIQAGQRSTWVPVSVFGDVAVEANETFQLVLTEIVGAVFQGNAPALIATGTIINDDGGPIIAGGVGDVANGVASAASAHASLPTLQIHNASQFEGNDSYTLMRFLVTLDKAPTAPVTVDYFTVDETASAGRGDYVGASGTLTLVAGQRSAWISIRIETGVEIESNETFRVVLTDLGGAVFAGNASALAARGAIIEDDAASIMGVGGVGVPGTQIFGPTSASATLPTISVSDVTYVEGDQNSTKMGFLVTLDKASATPVTFDAYFQDGTASDGLGDYDQIGRAITIEAGERSTWISVNINADIIPEDNETLQLVLTSASGAVFAGGVPALIATGTILDDDSGVTDPVGGGIGGAADPIAGPVSSHPTLPTVTVYNVSVIEGDVYSTTAYFLVTLDKASAAPITFNYRFQDGSASSAFGEYGAGGSTVTIEAGQTSTRIGTTIDPDTTVESNETFELVLSGISGAVFSGNAPALIATGAIIDDDNGSTNWTAGVGDTGSRVVAAPDPAGVPSVRVVSTSVNEGDSTTAFASVYVLLSHASASDITIQYTTVAGTAQAMSPADYGNGSGTLTILAGRTSANVLVGVYGDTRIEGDESFSVRFSNLNGAVFEGGGATVDATALIRDDESGTFGQDSGPNFVLSPNGTSGPDTLDGTPSNEALYGAAGNDLINGRGGADTLDGGIGADILEGGLGDDIFYVDNIGDVATDVLDGGVDTVSASRSWAVASNIERVILGGTGDFNVAGNGLGNVLRGNSGDNWLNGSFGKDTLTGGGGRDSFIFNREIKASNVDTITDYDVVRDVIRIDNAVFTGIGAAGALTAGAFNTGAAATQADDRIIYHSATGRLFFDIDGVGGVAQQHFATLSTRPTGMSAGEFIII